MKSDALDGMLAILTAGGRLKGAAEACVWRSGQVDQIRKRKTKEKTED